MNKLSKGGFFCLRLSAASATADKYSESQCRIGGLTKVGVAWSTTYLG